MSLWIQKQNTKILFDSGFSDVFTRNAEKLNIDLNQTDYIVLSHHHDDHASGLQNHPFTSSKPLIVHPQILPKLAPSHAHKLQTDFHITQSKDPLEFSPDIYYLGQIPRVTAFEKGVYKSDDMLDDSALAIKTPQGTVVISGCSHAGICNICEYAKQVTGQNLYAVLGGFHLFATDKSTVEATILYFQQQKPAYLYPMHCVDFSTLTRFYKTFGIRKLMSGETIKIN